MANDKFPVRLVFGPYTYNYSYVPPLAYATGIHLENLPSLDWILLTAKQAVRIVVNGLLAAGKKKLKADAATIRGILAGGHEADLLKFLEKDQQNLFAILRKDKKGLAGEEDRFASLDEALDWIKGILDSFHMEAGPTTPRTLAQYNEQFQILEVPEIAQHLHDSQTFADLRVAGYNPLVLERVTSLPAKFPLDPATFRKAPGFENDSLKAALAEGRLYLADYAALDVLEPGQQPAPKQVYRPIALFGVPTAGGLLKAIAIQVTQTPDKGTLFGPKDPGWNKAMTCVQSADSNYHEMISHLGRTHLLVEPFVVATYRRLEKQHPVRRLLMPHFEGTIFINGLAVDLLVNPGGPVDLLLEGTIESDLELAAEGVLSVPFDQSGLPAWLKNRGLDDPAKLPFYPYRDDGLLIWQAIAQWVSGYIAVFYSSDAKVQQDAALQAWAVELIAEDGGRVKGFGQNGGIQTRAYLAEVLTTLVFTASAAHAAVNFPQKDIMSYTPAVPLAGYEAVPSSGDVDAYPWIDLLPPLDMAMLQIGVLTLLGGVYYTRLGQYRPGYFKHPQLKPLLKNFQRRLNEIEVTIQERNLHRPVSYSFLLPSKIPQSINI